MGIAQIGEKALGNGKLHQVTLLLEQESLETMELEFSVNQEQI